MVTKSGFDGRWEARRIAPTMQSSTIAVVSITNNHVHRGKCWRVGSPAARETIPSIYFGGTDGGLRMNSWLDFWNRPNAVYVSKRHRVAHYARVLVGVSEFIPAGRGAIVLDWGCGDALAADKMAGLCGTLLLYEAAETTRRRLHSRFPGQSQIRVLDSLGPEAIAPKSVDLVIVNSVVQYLSRTQFIQALQLFHWVLKDNGRVLLGDIIEPRTPMISHVTTFLHFALRNHFFCAAVIGLLRNFASDYRRLRRNAGYACYTAPDMLALLRECGFGAERLRRNIAVSQHRASYLASKLDAASSSLKKPYFQREHGAS
jgi:SAM-dependent methyltransferase